MDRTQRALRPELSVLLPLENARGDAAMHLATWASAQTLERERFQLVVASGDSPRELLARVADLLAPHDVLLEVPGAGEVSLWNAAAAAASAPWLLISESHCLVEPTFLDALLKTLIAAPDLSAATLAVESVGDGRAQLTGGRWTEESVKYSAKFSPIRQYGTVIRASVFAGLGGLEERADQFSMALLGARLHQSGIALGHVPDARVKHLFEKSMRAASRNTVGYTIGECEMRSEADAVYFEEYFGYSSEWGNRYSYEASGARALVRALAAAVRVRSPDVSWLARELAQRVPASVLGPSAYIFLAKVLAAGGEQAVERLPLPASMASRTLVRAHRQRVHQTRLEWTAEHTGPLPRIAAENRGWPVEQLDAATLIGTHGLERHDGRMFRWTTPVAQLRIAPTGSAGAIVIDTLGLRGPPLGYVHAVLAGSRPLAREQLSDDGRALRIELGAADLRAARVDGLMILSRPLPPARSGPSDDRRLGMPLASAEAQPA